VILVGRSFHCLHCDYTLTLGKVKSNKCPNCKNEEQVKLITKEFLCCEYRIFREQDGQVNVYDKSSGLRFPGFPYSCPSCGKKIPQLDEK